MATKDNHSDSIVIILFNELVDDEVVRFTDIVDTADYDNGNKFTIDLEGYQDGDYAISFEDGDDPALADATTVPEDKIIGGSLNLSAAIVGHFPLDSWGLISTKRYIRMVITPTNVTNGATLFVAVSQSGEYNPQFQDGV